MSVLSCFADAPIGLLRHGAHERRSRHCHDAPFAAVVLEGGYQEAGDEGRWNVRPGDVLIHHAFESHLNRFDAGGAHVLILELPADMAASPQLYGHAADPDRLVRLAARDPRAASALLAESFVARAIGPLDWPDMLAVDLRSLEPFLLADWAERHGVRAETLSRGFRAAYGCTPKAYRADVRARAAFRAARTSGEPFAEVAHRLHFADQSHMTHAVARLTGATPGWWRRGQVDTRQPWSAPL